jgi:hypothetical protein
LPTKEIPAAWRRIYVKVDITPRRVVMVLAFLAPLFAFPRQRHGVVCGHQYRLDQAR